MQIRNLVAEQLVALAKHMEAAAFASPGMRFVIPDAVARKMTRTEYYKARSYARLLTRTLLRANR